MAGTQNTLNKPLLTKEEKRKSYVTSHRSSNASRIYLGQDNRDRWNELRDRLGGCTNSQVARHLIRIHEEHCRLVNCCKPDSSFDDVSAKCKRSRPKASGVLKKKKTRDMPGPSVVLVKPNNRGEGEKVIHVEDRVSGNVCNRTPSQNKNVSANKSATGLPELEGSERDNELKRYMAVSAAPTVDQADPLCFATGARHKGPAGTTPTEDTFKEKSVSATKPSASETAGITRSNIVIVRPSITGFGGHVSHVSRNVSVTTSKDSATKCPSAAATIAGTNIVIVSRFNPSVMVKGTTRHISKPTNVTPPKDKIVSATGGACSINASRPNSAVFRPSTCRAVRHVKKNVNQVSTQSTVKSATSPKEKNVSRFPDLMRRGIVKDQTRSGLVNIIRSNIVRPTKAEKEEQTIRVSKNVTLIVPSTGRTQQESKQTHSQEDCVTVDDIVAENKR